MGKTGQLGALTGVHFPPEPMKAGRFSSAPPPPPASVRAGRNPESGELGTWNKWGGFTRAGESIGCAVFALIPAGIVGGLLGAVVGHAVGIEGCGPPLAGLGLVWALCVVGFLTSNPGSTPPKDPWRPHDVME